MKATFEKQQRFSWLDAQPRDIALQFLKKSSELNNEATPATQDLVPPCRICENKIEKDQVYLRGGKNASKLCHYDCIWEALGPDAKQIREKFEGGKHSPTFPKRGVKVKTKAASEYSTEEKSLADVNFEYGELKGRLAEILKQNEELRAEKAELSREIVEINKTCRQWVTKLVGNSKVS